MILQPFQSNVSDFDKETINILKNKGLSISFFKGEDSIFNNIQRIIYYTDDNYYVVYVGYTFDYIYFMIQISPILARTIGAFGKVKEGMPHLNPEAQKFVPFFYKIFTQKPDLHIPFLLYEDSSIEFLCVLSYRIREIRTELDLQNGIAAIIKIGQKILIEHENGINAQKRSSFTKGITTLLRVFFHIT